MYARISTFGKKMTLFTCFLLWAYAPLHTSALPDLLSHHMITLWLWFTFSAIFTDSMTVWISSLFPTMWPYCKYRQNLRSIAFERITESGISNNHNPSYQYTVQPIIASVKHISELCLHNEVSKVHVTRQTFLKSMGTSLNFVQIFLSDVKNRYTDICK